jgi:16S rRNA (guanine1207-N2)-methyltransferase
MYGELRALIHPFEAGILRMPDRCFFLRAQAGTIFDERWRKALLCEQSFKPDFDALSRARFDVVTKVSGHYELGLCLLTKHKAENLVNIARGWSLLAPGGTLVGCGAKEQGAASIEKVVDEVVGLSGNLSKHHARTFWFAKRLEHMPDRMVEWLNMGRLKPNAAGEYLTQPGMFTWDKPDIGSALLLSALPEGIGGRVADLGAGWGYLSVNLARRYRTIETIDLYEAELLALEAARENAKSVADGPAFGFFWHDVSTGIAAGAGYDWIVMNPPHHVGRQVSYDLGRSFISAAAGGLRPGGKLVLVANRRLPYESMLGQLFKSTTVLTQSSGFKVLLSRA